MRKNLIENIIRIKELLGVTTINEQQELRDDPSWREITTSDVLTQLSPEVRFLVIRGDDALDLSPLLSSCPNLEALNIQEAPNVRIPEEIYNNPNIWIVSGHG